MNILKVYFNFHHIIYFVYAFEQSICLEDKKVKKIFYKTEFFFIFKKSNLT